MTRVPSPAGRAEASALAMLASAVAGAVGVVLIVLMYAAFAVGAQPPGLMFGWASDLAVLRIGSPRLALAGTLLALAGIAVIVVLQTLLVAGVLTFEQEIGPATLGFLILGAWMVVAAVVGRRAGTAPAGPATAIAAALYVGYSIRAYRVGPYARTPALASVGIVT